MSFENSMICRYPFFDTKSQLLKDMLGVSDYRSVIKRLQELQVPLYNHGKRYYVITEEALHAIRSEKKNNTGYTPKSELAKSFMQ